MNPLRRVYVGAYRNDFDVTFRHRSVGFARPTDHNYGAVDLWWVTIVFGIKPKHWFATGTKARSMDNPSRIDVLYDRLGDREDALHIAIDDLLDILGVDEEERDSERIAILDACCDAVGIEH